MLYLVAVAVLGVTLLLPSSVRATLLYIDDTQSVVSYFANAPITLGSPFPAPPELYSITGTFEVAVVHEPFEPPFFFGRDIVSFTNVQIESSAVTLHGFEFPTYPGLLTGEAISASENPCSLFIGGTGSCWTSSRPFGGFLGTFDGTTLVIDGLDPVFFDWFTFTIVASVSEPTGGGSPGAEPAAVESPGAVTLLIAGVALALTRRWMKSSA
jgi:hypothetical protein